MGYVVASNLWQPQTDMSFVVPDNVATTKWRLTKGALAPVAGARARLGVADFLTRLHLSTPVTPCEQMVTDDHAETTVGEFSVSGA